ncbi:lipopolysaccharide biosynthesis protein [Sphingomonas sp. DT-204]|uniref:lipopolysaccharide biosynthesis protein n=1 Tax=Sphingomonas sp. DT-204 TaxID=3396166 RepID=UPI003F1E184D
MRAIARNLSWMLASRGVLAVLSLVYIAIVTRTLGVSNFGRFALIVGASQALATLVGFQTWQIIVQYGTAYIHSGDEARLSKLVRACGLLDASSAVAGTLLAAVVIYQWGDALGVREVHARATMLFTVAQLLSIRSTPLGVLRMRDRFSLAALADSVTPIVRLVGAALAVLIKPTVSGFLVAWALAEILTAAAYWMLLARTGDLKLLTRGGSLKGVIREHPGIVRFALSTNANSTLGMSSKQVPLLLVGGIAGTASAGAFRLALQLAQALTKFSQLLARAAFPEIVRAIGTGGMHQVGGLIGRSFLMTSIIAAVVFVIIVMAGKPVLTLMGGSEFARGYPILIWLAAAGCVDLMIVGFEPLLLAANRSGLTFVVRLIAAAVLFALAFLLDDRLGVIGVAIAVLANSLVIALLLGIATMRLLRTGRNADA